MGSAEISTGCASEGNATAREMVLQAEDITCSGCAGDTEAILRQSEGLVEAPVDFANGMMLVEFPVSLSLYCSRFTIHNSQVRSQNNGRGIGK